MRTYPTDSPQAAARIVALTLVSDGDANTQEMGVLDRAGACETLGIDAAGMRTVLQELCEDMLQTCDAQWTDACRVEPYTVAQLLREVEDPVLRARVWRLCVAVADADGHIADGESFVLVHAVDQWGLQALVFEQPEQATAAAAGSASTKPQEVRAQRRS